MSGKPLKNLANKPGEPDFKLKIEPESHLIFKSDALDKKACMVKVRLENILKERQIFKIKCTSNEIFRVRPPLGYLDPGECQSIQIAFTSKRVPESYKHFFAFYHAKSNETRPPKQVWVPNFEFNGVKRMWCLFQKEDGTDFAPQAQDEKDNKGTDAKDEKKKEPAKEEDKKDKSKEKKEKDEGGGKKEEKQEEKK
uniref:Major sperm protein n=1 Tax=Parastrongyloides trichosuri TaxID=131310 RepID=A0A0N4ZUT5_PARTI